MPLGLHIATPLEHLRTMLSESPTFQQLVEAADAAEAAEKIYYGYAEGSAYERETGPQAPKPYPRAIVATEDLETSRTTTSSWQTNLQMSILLEVRTLAADKELSASGRYMAFLQRVEGVVDDLRAAAADLTRLNLQRISTPVPPMMIDPTETHSGGDFMPNTVNELWLVHLLVEAGG